MSPKPTRPPSSRASLPSRSTTDTMDNISIIPIIVEQSRALAAFLRAKVAYRSAGGQNTISVGFSTALRVAALLDLAARREAAAQL